METKKITIGQLKPAKYNPREITDFDLGELEKSLKNFGLVEPIVVNKDMTVIGGHQRLKAAENIGWKEIDCTIVDLDKKKEKILNLALNKIQGYMNEEKLTDIIAEIRNEAIGFREEEIEQHITRKELLQEERGGYNPDNDEELQALFKRKERVAVEVNEPNKPIRHDQIAFYTENFEQYKKIKEFFKTTRQGELDLGKLIGMLK